MHKCRNINKYIILDKFYQPILHNSRYELILITLLCGSES